MNPPKPRDVQLVVMVNKYATPLAILLVGLAMVLSQPVGTARAISVALLLFSVLFNLAAIPLIKKLSGEKPWITGARMWINIAVNVVMVYVLGGYWPSIWLLLALTPIATAIYDDRKKTVLAAAGVCGALFVLRLLSGGNTPSEWGEWVGRSAFIFLMSLLINELATAAREKA